MKNFLKTFFSATIILSTSLYADLITAWDINHTDEITLGVSMTTDGVEETKEWFLVDWGDGNETNVTAEGEYPKHTYDSEGNYTITITASDENSSADPRLYRPKLSLALGGQDSKVHLTSVVKFNEDNNTRWKTFSNAFKDCINLDYNATEALPSSDENTTANMFNNIKSVNGISSWDTKDILNMNSMFANTKNIDIDFSDWNTSKVTDMSYMFSNTKDSNLSTLNGWDTSKVTDMSSMFTNTDDLNLSDSNTTDTVLPDVRDWNTSSTTNMQDMFKKSGFNQDLSNWSEKIANVNNMTGLFSKTRISKTNLVAILNSWATKNENNTTIDIGKKSIVFGDGNHTVQMYDQNITVEGPIVYYTDHNYSEIATSLKLLIDNNWQIKENGAVFEALELGTLDTDRTTYEVVQFEDQTEVKKFNIYNSTIGDRNNTRIVSYNVSDYNDTMIALVVSESNTTEISASQFNNMNSNTLYFKSKKDQFGLTSIDINISDGFLSDTGILDINISGVDDSPTIDANITTSIEDGGLVFDHSTYTISGLNEGDHNLTFDIGIVDVDGDDINMTISFDGEPGIQSATIDGGKVIVIFKDGYSGTTRITIKAIANGQTTTRFYNISVAGINDKPTIDGISLTDITIEEDSGTTSYDINVSDNDGDDLSLTVESSNTLLINVTQNWSNKLLLASYNDQTLDFNLTTVKDAHGTAKITITLSDDINSTTKEYGVAVTPVYDIFTISSENTRYYEENFAPKNIPLHVTLNDTLQNDINYSVVYDDSIIKLDINDTTNIVSIESIADQKGSTDINITAQDQNKTEIKVNFIVNVGVDENLNQTNNSLISTVEETNTTIKSSDLNLTIEPENGKVSYTNGNTLLESNITATSKVTSTLKNGGKKQQVVFKINGSTTDFENDNGTLQIVTTYEELKSILTQNGTVTNSNQNSISKTDINNSIATVDENGNMELLAGEVDDGVYYIKGLVTIKNDGTVVTDLLKVSKTDDNNITNLNKTVSKTTPYSSGTVSEIIMIGQKLYIKNRTELTDNLKVQ